MIKLTHYNDGKENRQSHEISIKEDCFYNAEHDVSNHDIFSLVGYGESKEEAFERLQEKVCLCDE